MSRLYNIFFCLLIPLTLSARVALAIELDDIELPASSSTSWVANDMVQNGVRMQIQAFESDRSVEEVLAFYQQEFNNKTEQMTQVVVVGRDMLQGETISPEDLMLREIPVEYVHSSAVRESNYNLAIGQRLSFDIAKGKTLLWPYLEGGMVPTFSGKVPDGWRALTVPVDEINSISGLLQPTDNIDLLFTGRQGNEETTMPIMQNLHVLATGIQTVVDKTGQGGVKTYRTITVQVKPEDAKRIVLARDIGKITATLRHPQDQDPIANKGLSASELFGEQKKVKKPKAKPQKQGIEYIVGGV